MCDRYILYYLLPFEITIKFPLAHHSLNMNELYVGFCSFSGFLNFCYFIYFTVFCFESNVRKKNEPLSFVPNTEHRSTFNFPIVKLHAARRRPIWRRFTCDDMQKEQFKGTGKMWNIVGMCGYNVI